MICKVGSRKSSQAAVNPHLLLLTEFELGVIARVDVHSANQRMRNRSSTTIGQKISTSSLGEYYLQLLLVVSQQFFWQVQLQAHLQLAAMRCMRCLGA